MILKCAVTLFAIVTLTRGSILRSRNIPVEIRYERYEHHNGASNLAAKVQLSPEQLYENNLRLQKVRDHAYLNKNLDEKVQLSPEELLQSSKHIPFHPALRSGADANQLEKLGELRAEPIAVAEQPSKSALVEQAQDIIEKGLASLKKNFMPQPNEVGPTRELWEKLERDVRDYFTKEKESLGSSRQEQGGTSPPNFFQNIANNFQQIAGNFVQQFQGQNPPAGGGSEDEQGANPSGQNPIQGFVGYFTGGVQNIVSNLQNIGQNGHQGAGNATVLGDTGSNPQPPNFIGTFVNGVQQFFQGPQQLAGNQTQGDTGTGTTQQQGFLAGAINQFNQVVSNIIPPSQAPAASQGDEGTGSPGASQGGPIQQVFQQFGNLGTAFNQFIQGGPANKTQGSEEEPSKQPQNPNFIQNIGQNIGSAFQNIQNQFRPTQKPGEGSNPIVGQIQQVIGNASFPTSIPVSSSDSPVKSPNIELSATVEPESVTEQKDSTEAAQKA